MRQPFGHSYNAFHRSFANKTPSLDGLKKSDIEQQLDNFLSQNANRFSSDSRFTSYFNSRARQSPIKRESDVTPNRAPRRRATNKVEVEIPAATIEE